MMMTQTFIATIAFSIGLLAFCAGAWLTIWATSSNQVADVAAAKLTGYFVTILALVGALQAFLSELVHILITVGV